MENGNYSVSCRQFFTVAKMNKNSWVLVEEMTAIEGEGRHFSNFFKDLLLVLRASGLNLLSTSAKRSGPLHRDTAFHFLPLSTVPGFKVMGFCIVIFKAVGENEIAKFKNEDSGCGKHLYLFTVERK